ncbi:MAG: glycoside hydrolase family 3 N-terminal domain-containing protein [Veillonella sp.]|uniref:glycoside hydrolase family 3 N-terminal domain-containing protein n=1 Tax=Veillonella sp. TaxID=1926307 RepID=UPI001D8802B3|nr:glycoside hydrolase family 3 N-terminal domain-containing protein [Veillonella sp.]MBS4965574.1 glycoside hydrolase family 3 protein [Veillonella sp.]MDR3801848.1 glycoside hydrolase family 3 N-terminal domain-containing protein [Veillonella sp.]MDU1410597.1 glycoside hydrolase family 3 N-terminal domain-containing protein [Veillonella sp.]MDU5178383.1 glycoside hydrolase family 3 N-terminal domain-containing protein [Veillonella sp.]
MFRRIVAATMIGALALTTGCGLHNPFASKAEPVTYESVAQSELSPEEKVDKLVANMSDADKVGQLMMIGIHGKTLNDDAKFMLNEYRVGGIILFDRNMESKDQVKSLITDINKTGKSAGLTPLFIGIDQEGGAVARMEDQLIKVPPAEELGKEPIEQAVSLAKQSGTELKDLGFNINFAPVADLGLTYGRSFSTKPDDVVRYASTVSKAYDEVGLWYSYKHFPGIGKTDVDLHADTSVVPVSKETLLNEDTKVFVDLIKQSKPNTYAIMVSHAMYPQIDPDHPSSLSKAIITDWLRKDMGYNGVVVTDDMDMGALAKHYTFGDMAVQSILAGSDILLVCHEYEHMQEAYNGLMKAVKDGRISKERLDESVKRILLMKMSKIS